MGQSCSRSMLVQKSSTETASPLEGGGIYMSMRRELPPITPRPRTYSQSSTREAGVSSAFTPASIALWERQHKKKWEEDVIPMAVDEPCDSSIISREEGTLDNLTPLGNLHKQPAATRMVGTPLPPPSSSEIDAHDRWQQAPPGNIHSQYLYHFHLSLIISI